MKLPDFETLDLVRVVPRRLWMDHDVPLRLTGPEVIGELLMGAVAMNPDRTLRIVGPFAAPTTAFKELSVPTGTAREEAAGGLPVDTRCHTHACQDYDDGYPRSGEDGVLRAPRRRRSRTGE